MLIICYWHKQKNIDADLSKLKPFVLQNCIRQFNKQLFILYAPYLYLILQYYYSSTKSITYWISQFSLLNTDFSGCKTHPTPGVLVLAMVPMSASVARVARRGSDSNQRPRMLCGDAVRNSYKDCTSLPRLNRFFAAIKSVDTSVSVVLATQQFALWTFSRDVRSNKRMRRMRRINRMKIIKGCEREKERMRWKGFIGWIE